ncbi:hypothetical protein E2C01_029438 [Portunus trituberculatus]|uniref:Uncharacterized protein n=1 Tax=Portunus trituberculatus TaxID=210409 RepID=A0A5B7ERW0_PORTR|nr:hypothetical protein [Portunus trituberculatus]
MHAIVRSREIIVRQLITLIIINAPPSPPQELSSQSTSTTTNVSASIAPGVNIPIATKVSSTLVRRVPRLRGRCGGVVVSWRRDAVREVLSVGRTIVRSQIVSLLTIETTHHATLGWEPQRRDLGQTTKGDRKEDPVEARVPKYKTLVKRIIQNYEVS